MYQLSHIYPTRVNIFSTWHTITLFSSWKYDFIFSQWRFLHPVRLFAVNVTWDAEWQNNDSLFWGRAISQNWMSRMCEEWTICALASRLVSVNSVLTSLQECVQTNRSDVSQTDAERQNKDLNVYRRRPLAPVYFLTPFGWMQSEAEMDRIKVISRMLNKVSKKCLCAGKYSNCCINLTESPLIPARSKDIS